MNKMEELTKAELQIIQILLILSFGLFNFNINSLFIRC